MSTFGGRIEEINDISIDNFTGINLDSKVFFLSHCHTDHMIGLNNIQDDFAKPLYLSDVSSVIIRRKYPKLVNLNCLKIGQPTIIPASEGEHGFKLIVTAIPAGHCPGSIMLLFEQNNLRVLYTGDFRLNRKAIHSIVAFKDVHNEILPIDSAYIDSTFLSSNYLTFPNQKQSIESIIKIIQMWLDKNENNNIVLRPPALYGYEYLLVEISKHFHQKIHISQQTYADYKFLPEFDNYFSESVKQCERIHLCFGVGNKSWSSKSIACLPDVDEKNICIVRPTAMKWKNWKSNDETYSLHEDISNIYFVCYSTHSSYEEIKDLLIYLKPNCVKLNVIPSDVKDRSDMHKTLDMIIAEYKPAKSFSTTTSTEIEIKDFNRIVINRGDTAHWEMHQHADSISKIKIKRRKQE